MESLPPLRPNTFFLIGVATEASLIVLTALLGEFFYGDPFPFTLRFDVASVGLALAATVPVGLYAVLATSERGLRFASVRRIHDLIRDLAGRVICEMSSVQLLIVALAAGLGEEFLFRGVLQARFGLLTTSAVFGLLHALTPSYLVLAFVLSLYIGWIYEATDNIAIPVLIHALYDALALILLKRRMLREGVLDPPRESGDAPDEPGAEDDSDDANA